MAFARSKEFGTPECRISFAQNLFKPRSINNGEPHYGCTLIFKRDCDRREMDEAVKGVIIEQWGEKGWERALQGVMKLPFLKGDGKEARVLSTGAIAPGLGPDVFFIRPQANVDRPPAVHWKSKLVPATQEEVYSGCYGFAVLNAYAWHHPQSGDGVSFGIRYFQKRKEGEPLGGGGPLDLDKWFDTSVEDEGPPPAAMLGKQGAGSVFD
jgi:hypothetical protein